jgi:NADH-quinone oxidoreductase subunit J
MTPLHLLFYIYAAIAVISALVVITVRHPVRSVLSLVVTFFAMAGLWMILHAEFLSLILVLVYVGAVMTLFLFVVMMLNIDREIKSQGFVRYLPIGILLILLFVGLIILSLQRSFLHTPQPIWLPKEYSNVTQIGTLLFSHYVYPFEIAGVILLAAIVAAITLSHRPPRLRKIQNINKQVNTQAEESVRLINLSSEGDS